jgi:hypothetical protein
MRLHSGSDGRSDCFFSDSESLEYFCLAFFGGASVTAHRGNQERPAATRFHCVNDAGEQVDKTTHPATTGSDCDLRIRFQRVEEPGLEQLLLSFMSQVVNVISWKKLRHVSEWR